MKKQLVLTCMSLFLSFPLLAKKNGGFSLLNKYDSMVNNKVTDHYTQLTGHRELDARKYFDKLKIERTNYYERNQKSYGKSFTLTYKIALIASRLMEKKYGGESSFRTGLECFHQLTMVQGDVPRLQDLLRECSSKLSDFRLNIKEEKIDYEVEFSPRVKKFLKEEIKSIFSDKPEASKYFKRSLKPEMDCYYHGGSFSFTIFGGFSATAHRLKCRTKLGRKVVYNVVSGNFTTGFGLTVSVKKARFFKNDGEGYRRKTFPLTYANLRRARIYGSIILSTAAVLGVTCNIRNLTTITPDSNTFGFGATASFGTGGIMKDKKHKNAKIKNQDHDFRELFYYLGFKFS